MTHAPHPFLPGTAVLTKKRSSPRWDKDTIAKLHKTGRFTLKSEDRKQYYAHEEWENGKMSHWEGRPITLGYFAPSVVLLWTAELEAEKHAESEKYIAADLRQHEARKLVEALRKISPSRFDETRLAALCALVASFRETASDAAKLAETNLTGAPCPAL